MLLDHNVIEGKKVLAVIPARGGSKRVPQKNLTLYKGKALIEWAIEHAAGAQYIDRWVVSTDDKAIAAHAGEHLLQRPDFLATDRASSESALVHALYALPGYDFAILLQPTSPERLISDIERCIETAVKMDGYANLHGCVSYNDMGKRNGAVYVVNVRHFLATLSLDAAHHYIMPVSRSLDIDYPWQFS